MRPPPATYTAVCIVCRYEHRAHTTYKNYSKYCTVGPVRPEASPVAGPRIVPNANEKAKPKPIACAHPDAASGKTTEFCLCEAIYAHNLRPYAP